MKASAFWAKGGQGLRRLPVLRMAFGLGLLAAAGCLQLDAHLALKPDGGGELRLAYAMPEHAIRQMEWVRQTAVELRRNAGETGALPPLEMPCLFDEAAIRARFRGWTGRGVRLRSVAVSRRQEWMQVEAAVEFDSLETLAQLPMLGDCAVAVSQEQNQSYRLAVCAPKMSGRPGLPDFADPETQQMLKSMLNGCKITVRIEPPTEILKSNAPRSDGRAVIWEYDVDRSPAVLAALDGALFEVFFRGLGADIPVFDKKAVENAAPSTLATTP